MKNQIDEDARRPAMRWPMLIAATIALSMTPAASGQSPCKGTFRAPTKPMKLSRQIHRSLADGNELVVTRHYRITFKPDAKGFLVEGQWLATDVDAPPRLAGLAALERSRAATTTFPIHLDKVGTIIPNDDNDSPQFSENEANAARQLVDGAALKPNAQQQATKFIEQLTRQMGIAITQWPSSLFRPSDINSEFQRELPQGQDDRGRAIISLSAQSSEPCGVMQQMERKVKTMIDGQIRETREIWTMEPATD